MSKPPITLTLRDYYPHIVEAMKKVSIVLILRRTCKHCLEQWDCREVPIAKSWPQRVKADRCPECGGKGICETTVTKRKLERPGATYASPGLMLVMRGGGIYRRRKCKLCGQRWTTGEFRTSLTLDPEVNKCARCGGYEQLVENWGRK